MSELCFACVACHKPAEDEYHWYEGGQEIVWKLCEDHCEFAVDVVESITYLETEVERWKSI